MRIDPLRDILGLIDVQPTFMPGGGLPVPDGAAVVPVINRLLAGFGQGFATQDWHPANHISFASSHPGRVAYETVELGYGTQVLWPEHAVAGSQEAALHPRLDQTALQVVIRKGYRRMLDSYSGFFENDRRTATGLDGWLRQRGFSRLFLTGLATDFCVAWSAEDAVRLGYQVVLIEDACRGIGLPDGPGKTTLDTARQRLTGLGVQVLPSSALVF